MGCLPITAVLAQCLLSRALLRVPSALTKPLAAACALLAAKSLQFSPPSLRSVSLTLRVSGRAVASCESDVLCALGGDLLDSSFKEAIRLWGPLSNAGQGCQNHVALCLAMALEAANPRTGLQEADVVARSMLSGGAPLDLQKSEALVRACRAGECLAYFRAWPNAWADFTAVIRAWSASAGRVKDG